MSDFNLRYTEITRNWLDYRFSLEGPSGLFWAHEPIYGIKAGLSEPGFAHKLMRLYDLLRILKAIRQTSESETLLDVGAAEGYLAYRARADLAYDVAAIDLSSAACARAREILDVPSFSANASCLPLESDSIDVVTIAEVVEHLTDPIGAILEAIRVARRFVVLSTEEWHEHRAHRDHVIGARVLDSHMERNVFADCDDEVLFGSQQRESSAQRLPIPNDEIADEVLTEQRLIDLLCHDKYPLTQEGRILVISVNSGTPPGLDRLDHSPDIVAALARGAADIAETAISPRWLKWTTPHDSRDAPSAAEPASWDRYAYVPNAKNIDRLCSVLGITAGRQQDLHALDQLFALAPSGRTDWRPEDRVGWKYLNMSSHGPGHRSSTADPQVVSEYIGVPISEVDGVECELSISGVEGDALAELFILTDGMFEFEQSVSSQAVVREGDHIINFPIPPDAHVRGQHIVRFRIDPVSQEGAVIVMGRITLRPGRSRESSEAGRSE